MTGPSGPKGHQGQKAIRATGPCASGPQGPAYQDVTDPGELREWRRRQGWTQTYAARWYNVTLRHWQRYELAESPIPPNLTRLIAWRERLGDSAGIAD